MTGDLPAGWLLQQGAGGWRAIQPDRKWETITYRDDKEWGPGRDRAIRAAIELQERAERTLAEQQRQCAALRRCLTND